MKTITHYGKIAMTLLVMALCFPAYAMLGIMSMGSITGKLGSLLGGGAAQAAPARAGYGTTIVPASGDTAYNTNAKIAALVGGAGVKARIWELTVPAQMAMTWGFGSALTPDNQGYIWFVGLDDGVDFSVGTITLSHENHARLRTYPIDQFVDLDTHEPVNTSLATAKSTNKKQMRALPEPPHDAAHPLVGQDSRLVIDYQVITPATAIDELDFAIPATVYS